MEFANLTHCMFEPLPAAVAVDAIANDVYTTPAVHRPKLGDLARLSYTTARARASVYLNQASAGGAATLRLNDGSTDVASFAVDLTAGTRIDVEGVVDLSGIAGNAALRWALDVSAAADGGTTAQVAGVLEVEHPLVVGCSC